MINSVLDYLFSFRFINFVWMAGCGWYAIKRWLVPDFKEAIFEQKNKISHLRVLIKSHQEQQAQVEKEIYLQKKTSKDLFAKVSLWNAEISEKNKAKEQEKRALNHTYQQYKIGQYRSVELLYAKRNLQQDVVLKTVQDLSSMYASQESQQAFLQHVLEDINKEQ